MIGIGFLIALILFTGKRWMNRSRRNSWIESREAEPVKALIAAVGMGMGETAAETAIKFHKGKLEHCWLLVTKQADENYQNIYAKYGEKIGIYKREIEKSYEIQDAFDVMKNIYNEAATKGIKEKDILCDYTGATASVSAAMILVTSLSENRNLQYLVPNDIDESGMQ